MNGDLRAGADSAVRGAVICGASPSTSSVGVLARHHEALLTCHPGGDDAEAHIAQLRARYRAGAPSLRLVRLYDPDGGVQLVDFGAEVRDQSRALRDLERATGAKDRALREATERWEEKVRRVAGLRFSLDEVAQAAGLSRRELNCILRQGPTAP